MALTQLYVDPSIASDSGTGTIGDPYGDLQYGLDSVTRDSTNGDQFNIIGGTAEVLAALMGVVSGGGTATVTFQHVDGSGNAIVAVVDTNGNRTTMTLTP